MRYRKIYPRKTFRKITEEEKILNRNKFEEEESNTNLIKFMNEISSRMLWNRTLIDSLWSHVDRKGCLSDAQMGLVTNLYIDNCAWSDSKIKEQQAARKLCYRLIECRLGRSKSFIQDLFWKSENRPFSRGQLRALYNVANRFRVQLDHIPEIETDEWDGWFKKQKETE
jgi:hypothetical protein